MLCAQRIPPAESPWLHIAHTGKEVLQLMTEAAPPAQVTLAYLSLMGFSSETAISRPLLPGWASSFLFLQVMYNIQGQGGDCADLCRLCMYVGEMRNSAGCGNGLDIRTDRSTEIALT